MRLDYFIATATSLSRKDAKRAIGKGQVKRNGQLCRQASVKLEADDQITLDDLPLTLPEERYLMLHKPSGVISATSDSQQPTVLDLLTPQERRGLHIAGRLDLDTTGLLLLTSDGQWSHRVTSPRGKCDKTYRVSLSAPITPEAATMLEKGVMLKGESTPTQPAEVRVINHQLIELTISEGRYHQIKRMMAAVGNHVNSLHRLSIGGILLDPSLAPGQFRSLTPEEISSVE